MIREYDKGQFQKSAISKHGCGAGTENACFALVMGKEGFGCGLIDAPEVAGMAGMVLGWRVNVDNSDDKAWCPLAILNNSKIAPD